MSDHGLYNEDCGWEDQDDHIDYGDEDYYEGSIGVEDPGPRHIQVQCEVSGSRALPCLTSAQSVHRLPAGATFELFVSFHRLPVYNAVKDSMAVQPSLGVVLGTIDANVRFSASRIFVRHDGETAFGSDPPFHPLGPKPPSIWLQLQGQSAGVFGGGYVWIGGEQNILTVFGSLRNPTPPRSPRLRVAALTFRCVDTPWPAVHPFLLENGSRK